MKKVFLIVFVLGVFVSGICFAAGPHSGPNGPAPNSGDCVPDGSGLGSGNQSGLGSGNQNGFGPAPNSGDGVPDGSGLDPENLKGKGPAPNSGDGIPDGSGF